jgi:hypothetical protein
MSKRAPVVCFSNSHVPLRKALSNPGTSLLDRDEQDEQTRDYQLTQ